jgi:hypothetical protein
VPSCDLDKDLLFPKRLNSRYLRDHDVLSVRFLFVYAPLQSATKVEWRHAARNGTLGCGTLNLRWPQLNQFLSFQWTSTT